MDSKDLRIGNVITDVWASSQSVWPIIKFTKYKAFYGPYSCHFRNLKPVELTPYFLKRLGFTKSSSKSELWSYGNTMLIWRTEYQSDELDNYYEFRFGITYSYGAHRQVRLDYVHQLQNLTYFLTGEELILE